jgi:trehalose 6-phosphate phosphatase
MKHILAPEHRGEIKRLMSLPTLLAFGFDGTLAPTAADPSDGEMRPATRTRLRALAQRRPCAVISGRALHDVARRLHDVPLAAIVGNHGIEPEFSSASFEATIAALRATLSSALAGVSGIVVEDKRYSLTVHYRAVAAPDKKMARARIDEALHGAPDVRVVGGDVAVHVLPHDAPDKGRALCSLVEKMTFGAAVYVGDDETDEDVFRLATPPEVLTIRVGLSHTTRASYALEHQQEIDDLLDALIR